MANALILIVSAPVLVSCAVGFSDLSPKASVCRTQAGSYELAVSQIEIIRGSVHTPFDYGNKSVSEDRFLIRLADASERTWNAEDLEVLVNGHPAHTRVGKVVVSKTYLDFDLRVAGPADVKNPAARVSGRLLSIGAQSIAKAASCASPG